MDPVGVGCRVDGKPGLGWSSMHGSMGTAGARDGNDVCPTAPIAQVWIALSGAWHLRCRTVFRRPEADRALPTVVPEVP